MGCQRMRILPLVLSIALIGQSSEETSVVRAVSDSNRIYSVDGWVERETYVELDKPNTHRDRAYLRISNRRTGAEKSSRMVDAIDIDAAILTGESRLVTVAEKRNGWGHRITSSNRRDTMQ